MRLASLRRSGLEPPRDGMRSPVQALRQYYLDKADECLLAATFEKDASRKHALFDAARGWITLSDRPDSQSVH